ncbi:Cysteine-rich RLK (RECEPTOR-like protein kinase) 8 [Cucumis melo var. makuwa]|uniref:Cysteine-rich RLK (RECEPTOR-like protein kinase) 8 n=1 Tax=Cucumis melo var. makuwa TaxID=1194695 RepID=A0A5A7TEZ6_CUCMM|nr:Cysteine-rich RLK (RECEPTOR-like protein kinase) 8 [Cucumis melo var. makuwa]
MAKAQILSDSKIPLLDDASTCVMRIESYPTGVSIPQSSNALISKNNNPRAPRAMDSNVQRNSYDHRKPDFVEIFVTLDRVMKKIIGRGYKSGGFYLFDQVPQAVVCPIVPSLFEVYCHRSSIFVRVEETLSRIKGEDDNLFIYEVTTLTPSSSTNAPPSRPLLSRVYSRRHPPQPSDSCLPSMLPSCDPGPSDDLPIALRKSLSHPGWKNAMIEEMTALDDNGTWDLVSCPTGKEAIGCKWVFAVKVNPDRTMAR